MNVSLNKPQGAEFCGRLALSALGLSPLIALFIWKWAMFLQLVLPVCLICFLIAGFHWIIRKLERLCQPRRTAAQRFFLPVVRGFYIAAVVVALLLAMAFMGGVDLG